VLLLSFILLAAIVWLIARAFRQRHALARLVVAPPPDDAPRVAVIVPARNESANIGPCLNALVAQDYPRLAIVVVDDESRDDTAGIVRRIAGRDRRVVLMESPRLPPGWTGKVNACTAGARAVADAAQWLCFLDADMRTQPALISSAVIAAAGEGIDLLMLAPRQELKSFAERLVLPCGLYLLSFSQNIYRMQSADSDDAVATGQFMLIRRDAYEDVGGHAAVSRSITEDIDLARLMKRRGHRVLMQDGTALLSTRMYTAAIGATLAWAAVLLPAFDLTGCIRGAGDACLAAVPAFLGSAAAFGLHIAGAAYFRIPWAYGLLFPLGYTAGALIALDSLRWRMCGRVRWKGRVYK